MSALRSAMVVAVDRGRFGCLVGGREVTAMLGQRDLHARLI